VVYWVNGRLSSEREWRAIYGRRGSEAFRAGGDSGTRGLTASAGSRSGTPQDRHPHGLLAGGLRALGEIFPGFESDLARAGAVPVGVAQELLYERPDVGVLPKRDFGISVLCASRPLIELVLRRRAEAVLASTLVVDFRVDPQRRAAV
jgi:hypothetical protein